MRKTALGVSTGLSYRDIPYERVGHERQFRTSFSRIRMRRLRKPKLLKLGSDVRKPRWRLCVSRLRNVWFSTYLLIKRLRRAYMNALIEMGTRRTYGGLVASNEFSLPVMVMSVATH